MSATAERVQRVNTATMDAIMAEVEALPLREQLEFAFTLCRKSRSHLPEDQRLQRIRVAFHNAAFNAWVLAHGDVLGVAHEDDL